MSELDQSKHIGLEQAEHIKQSISDQRKNRGVEKRQQNIVGMIILYHIGKSIAEKVQIQADRQGGTERRDGNTRRGITDYNVD